MEKIALLLLVVCFSLSNLLALNRDSIEAHQLALGFFNKTSENAAIQKAPATIKSVRLVFSKVKKNELSTNYYYIFNQTDNKGFVIISGYENTNDILAYSNENSFDPQNIPDNVMCWLTVYEDEMNKLNGIDTYKYKSENPKSNKLTSASKDVLASVSPLLSGIKWNQGSPYNDLCPIYESNKRSATGCVATGMAQVMKYHKWPVKGAGSNSYITTKHQIPLSLDFSQTTFDWENMTNTYNSSSTAISKNAVATLMYNCGVAVSMNYGSSSSAYTKDAAKVLINNFGYDSNIQYFSRNFYTRGEWVEMLKEELSAARPVMYSGRTETSGHLFVCDGYDSNDFFHFNWGWGGSSDGYFRISVLDPSSQGIGGSTGGYNIDQGIVTGVQKPSILSRPTYLIASSDSLTFPTDSLRRSESFTIKVNSIYNRGINSFSGQIGLALYDNSDNYLLPIKTNTVILNDNRGWPSYTFSALRIPQEVSIGNYKIFCVYKADAESDWQFVRAEVGRPNYVNVAVTSKSICLSAPTNESPILLLNSLTETGNLYNNRPGLIRVNITNNGKEYDSFITIKLQSSTEDNIYQIMNPKRINIAEGETRDLSFNDSIKLPAGAYYLSTLYNSNNFPNSNDLTQLGNNITVNVLRVLPINPSLSLLSAISFPEVDKVNKDNAVLSAKLLNSGALYNKPMIAYIFLRTGGTSLASLGLQDVEIAEDETVNLIFQGPIELALGDYSVALYYKNTQDQWTRVLPTNHSKLNFTLVENSTSVLSVETKKNLILSPNPATDLITIKSNNLICAYRIINLLGEEIQYNKISVAHKHTINISSFNSGTYIIHAETEVGNVNLKFIKQ